MQLILEKQTMYFILKNIFSRNCTPTIDGKTIHSPLPDSRWWYRHWVQQPPTPFIGELAPDWTIRQNRTNIEFYIGTVIESYCAICSATGCVGSWAYLVGEGKFFTRKPRRRNQIHLVMVKCTIEIITTDKQKPWDQLLPVVRQITKNQMNHIPEII